MTADIQTARSTLENSNNADDGIRASALPGQLGATAKLVHVLINDEEQDRRVEAAIEIANADDRLAREIDAEVTARTEDVQHRQTNVFAVLAAAARNKTSKARTDALLLLLSLGPEAVPDVRSVIPTLIEELSETSFSRAFEFPPPPMPLRLPGPTEVQRSTPPLAPALPMDPRRGGNLREGDNAEFYWYEHTPAAESLSRIGEPAVEPLIAALSHSDYRVRTGAAEALGEIGSNAGQAVPALRAALDDGRLVVRLAARRALVQVAAVRRLERPHIPCRWLDDNMFDFQACASSDPASLGPAPTREIETYEAPETVEVSRDAPPLCALTLRSYELPFGHSNERMLRERCFLYDASLAVVIYSLTGNLDRAERLLLTMECLQNENGSIGYSWNSHRDRYYGASYQRTGAIAWTGYAAATYERAAQGDLTRRPPRSRVLELTRKIAAFIVAQQVKDPADPRFGLVRGGQGQSTEGGSETSVEQLEWCATEHQIDSYFFLRELARLTGDQTYAESAELIKKRTVAVLWDEKEGRFYAGIDGDGAVNDDQVLDACSWGAMMLFAAGEQQMARRCLAYAETTFASSANGVSGFKPYVGRCRDQAVQQWDAIKMVWCEGTLAAR